MKESKERTIPGISGIFSLLIIFNILIAVECAANEDVDKIRDKKIYFLNWHEIGRVTSNIGYPDFIDHDMSRYGKFGTISRNNDGTQ